MVGVDASVSQTDNARVRCPDIEFHVPLIEDFNIDEKLDTVMIVNLLEHVINPVRVNAIAPGFTRTSMLEALRPDI